MAADPARNRVVLFGGETHNPTANLGDTWEWDGSEWVQSQDVGPSARMGSRMAYNVSDENILLFGGFSDAGETGDTWAWNGMAWTQIADTGPEPRHIHAMASDGVGVILFGGQVRNGDVEAGDRGCDRETWGFYDKRWRQLQDMGPSARCLHAVTYNDQDDNILMFGGCDNTGAMVGDTWYLAERPGPKS